MADALTDRLGLIAQEEGQHANEWGDLLNLNLQRLDSAVRGYISIALTTDKVLDATDITTTGITAQENSFFKFLEFTGTPGATIVTVPAEDIVWTVYNNTDGIITFTPSGGTGVAVAVGKTQTVVYGSSGTTMVDMTATMTAAAITAVTGVFAGAVTTGGILSVDDTTDTSSGVTGSIHTDGGLGVAKKLYVGTDATIAGDAIITGDVTIGGTNIFAVLFPVGSFTLGWNPQSLIEGSTFVQLAEGTFLMNTVAASDASGGSNDAVNISHNHTMAHTHNMAHTHTRTQYTDESGTPPTYTVGGDGGGSSGSSTPSNQPSTPNTGAASNGTTTTDGDTGTDLNKPLYVGVAVWERTV